MRPLRVVATACRASGRTTPSTSTPSVVSIIRRSKLGSAAAVAEFGSKHYGQSAELFEKFVRDHPRDGHADEAPLSDGGQIFMPMEETFFALRFSMLRDKFGTSWMIIHERPMPPSA